MQTRRLLLLTAAALALLLCTAISATARQPAKRKSAKQSRPASVMVGYLPDYRMKAVSASELGRYYSDIILFSIEPTTEGGLDTARLDAKGYGLIDKLRRAGVKRVLVTVGGSRRSGAFSAVCADASLRHRFEAALLKYCRAHGFDGADYDWELPETPQDKANYVALIGETHKAFVPKKLLVTAAVVVEQQLDAKALAALDRVHLMAYDNEGQHSTYEFATGAAEYWISKGLPASKLCLGVPFYGRSVTEHMRAVAYGKLVGQEHFDPASDVYHDLYFNGPQTLARKASFARSEKLAGIMVWEVGQDSADASLSKALHQALSARTR